MHKLHNLSLGSCSHHRTTTNTKSTLPDWNSTYIKEETLTESSRIANQADALGKQADGIAHLPQVYDYHAFQSDILEKVERMEQQTNVLLQTKQQQLYALKTQLNKTQHRLHQAEKTLANTHKHNQTPHHDYAKLVHENQQLKESLRVLIDQKNEATRHQGRAQPALRRQVDELRAMVNEMKELVQNCPSCLALRRDLQHLSEAYGWLLKQHQAIRKSKVQGQEQMRARITSQIQQNQNILRENNLLREQRPRGRPYLLKPQRMRDSVAKRCRTLADQF